VSILVIRKEDLHSLIDLIDERDNEPFYKILRKIINKNAVIIDGMIVEFDVSPLTEEEKEAIEQAEKEYDEGEYQGWEELKNDWKI
jgi:hypothetical protein